MEISDGLTLAAYFHIKLPQLINIFVSLENPAYIWE
jgi:hypothetical protein